MRFTPFHFAEEQRKMSFDELIHRTTTFTVPTPPSADQKVTYVLLGVLNCILFGVGMMVIGCITNDTVSILIGLFQLVLPFVGWVWAIIWGVLIVLRSTQ